MWVVVFGFIATASRMLQIDFCIRKPFPNIVTNLQTPVESYLQREVDRFSLPFPCDNARSEILCNHKSFITNPAQIFNTPEHICDLGIQYSNINVFFVLQSNVVVSEDESDCVGVMVGR